MPRPGPLGGPDAQGGAGPGHTTHDVVDELTLTTVRRLFLVGVIAVPVSLGHLAVFWRMTPTTAEEGWWRTGILAAHAVLVVLMAAVAGIAARARGRSTGTPAMRVFVGVVFAAVLVIGAVIATIDQWVTTAITPFIVACVLAGLVLLIRPLPAALGFLGGYVLFAVGIGLTQSDPSVVVSNRVNGITIAALGFGLSLILWRSEARNVLQRRRIEQQQCELEERNRELAALAAYDELTGLVNRREFRLLLDHEVARLRRDGDRACLMLLDVDDFKPINDAYGHPAGDAILRWVADALRERLRGSDIVARWGGEEFMVLLPGTGLDQAEELAEQQRARFATDVIEFDERQIRFTVSLGVAPLDIRADEPFVASYRRVDAALYEAKERGKNRVAAAR